MGCGGSSAQKAFPPGDGVTPAQKQALTEAPPQHDGQGPDDARRECSIPGLRKDSVTYGREDPKPCEEAPAQQDGHRADEAGLESGSAGLRQDTVVDGRDASEAIKSTETTIPRVKNVQQGSIDKDYTISRKPMARGGYGTVFTAVEKSSNMTRAVKQISKDRMDMEELAQEIEISKSMTHPNVIRLVASYQDNHYVQLVMELCEGGELFELISKEKKLGEQTVAKIMEQILRAVAYIHSKGIVHCDIKPENFLFTTKEPIENNTLKLVDFGLSKHVKGDERLSEMVGSSYYLAPEVLKKDYGKECDVWSCGVIMYLMLCGQPPFSGMSDQQIFQKIKKGEYRLHGRLWEPVSDAAKDLIRKMLTMDPKSRVTAEHVFLSHWIQQAADDDKLDEDLLVERLHSLRSFASVSRFKRVTLVAVAHEVKEEEVVKLQQTFKAIDKDGNGSLSMQEMKDAFTALPSVDEQELTRLFAEIDVNNDNRIDYDEFIAAAMTQRLDVSEQAAWVAFKAFDLNNNGFVSLQELREVLEQNGVPVGTSSCESMDQYQKYLNDEGEISFEDFRRMLKEDSSRLIAQVSSALAQHAGV